MIVSKILFAPNAILFKTEIRVFDIRGYITAFEGNHFLPFDVRRIYFIHKVPKGVKRGYHSHINLHQAIICINGSVTIILDDGSKKKNITLNSSDKLLYIGPNVWRTMKWNDDSAILVVLASESYIEKDYVRDYITFKKRVT